VVTEDQHGTTRIKQSQYLVRWLPTPSKPGPSAYKKAGIHRKDGTRVAVMPLPDGATARFNTRRTRPMLAACDKTYHTQQHHTLPPLKMKQNSGDARLAATPPTHPPGRSYARLLGDAWKKTSVDPGMAAAIKEWNTVYKDQAPHARVQTHSTRTSPTVSDKACGRMKVDQHTRQAGSLETHC
jgi:hypothetical protein